MNQTKTIEQQLIDDYTINGCKPMNMDAMAQYNADELVKPNSNGIKRDTRFKAGNKLGGRPKGSRSKLSEVYLADCYQLWLEKGNQALRDMLADSPTKFCQMISAIVPKSIEIDPTDGINWVINASPRLSVEEWQAEHGLEHHTEPVSSTETIKDTTG